MATSPVFLCPVKGIFYACGYGGRFLGCCENGNTADVCANGCAQDALHPASFQQQHFDKVTPNQCSAGSLWWTCQQTSPPFMGCCKTDPCAANGCPDAELTAAILSTNQEQEGPYSPIMSPPLPTSSSSSSTSASVTATSSSGSQTDTATTATATVTSVQPAMTGSPPSHGSSSGIIAGAVIGSIGGIIILIALFAVLLRYCCKKSRRKRATAAIITEDDTKGTSPFPIQLISFLTFTTDLVRPEPAPMYPKRDAKTTHYELPPNFAPIREIGSSETPQPVFELESPEPNHYLRPKVSHPNGLGFNPYSPGSVSPSPDGRLSPFSDAHSIGSLSDDDFLHKS